MKRLLFQILLHPWTQHKYISSRGVETCLVLAQYSWNTLTIVQKYCNFVHIWQHSVSDFCTREFMYGCCGHDGQLSWHTSNDIHLIPSLSTAGECYSMEGELLYCNIHLPGSFLLLCHIMVQRLSYCTSRLLTHKHH